MAGRGMGGGGSENGEVAMTTSRRRVFRPLITRQSMEPLALASEDTSLSGLVATLSERYDPTNADHTAALRQLWELAWPETPWETATGASEVSPCGRLSKVVVTSRQPRGSLAAARRQPRGSCSSPMGCQPPLWARRALGCDR